MISDLVKTFLSAVIYLDIPDACHIHVISGLQKQDISLLDMYESLHFNTVSTMYIACGVNSRLWKFQLQFCVLTS